MKCTRDKAHNAFSRTIKNFSAKYLKAMKCLTDSKEELLAFYEFPAEHQNDKPNRVDLCYCAIGNKENLQLWLK
jgi:transposase-like protein